MGSACPCDDRQGSHSGNSGLTSETGRQSQSCHQHGRTVIVDESVAVEGATMMMSVDASSSRDEDHGSVALFHAYSGDQLKSTNAVEEIFKELRKKPECASEFDLEGPRTNAWRMGARLCCVNTPIYNDPGLSKSTCIRLMQTLMGDEYCPAEATLKKCHDGFWIVAVGLSVLVRKLVTPYRAAACFKRFRNQKYAMTEYGFDLLRRHGARWPPYPEAASEIISSAARPTTTTVTTTTTTHHHHRHHNAVKDFVTVTAHCDHDAPSSSMMAVDGAAPEAVTFSQLTMQNLLMEMMQQEPSVAVDGRIDGPIGESAVNHNKQQDSSPFSPSLELLMGVDLDVHHHHCHQQVSELLAGSVMLASSETTRDFSGEDCCKSQSLNNGGAVPSIHIHNGLMTTAYDAAEQQAAAARGAETATSINDTFPAVCDIINSSSLGDGTTSPAAVGTVTNMQRAASLCMLDILLGPIATQEPHSGLIEPPLLSLSRPGSGTLAFLAAGCPLS